MTLTLVEAFECHPHTATSSVFFLVGFHGYPDDPYSLFPASGLFTEAGAFH